MNSYTDRSEMDLIAKTKGAGPYRLHGEHHGFH
jgi:hypothetical protein